MTSNQQNKESAMENERESGTTSAEIADPQPAAEAGAGRPETSQAGTTGEMPGNRTPNTHQEPPPGHPHPAWGTAQLPPGYLLDPATGHYVFVGPAYQPPPHPGHPGFIYPGYVQAGQEPPEQAAARQAALQQRQGVILHSIEQFINGEATAAEVVQTLYTNTAQNDQLWKGVLVGAAAAVLLTSRPVREAMGKTAGNLFPGRHQNRNTSASKSAEPTSPPVPTKNKAEQ